MPGFTEWRNLSASWLRGRQGAHSPTLVALGPSGQLGRFLDARTPRERILLAAMALVLGVAVFVLAIWGPLNEAREATLARIGVLDRVIAVAGSLDPKAIARAPTSSPATAITNQAASFGLVIRRLETDGDETRVSLDGERFETVLLWIEALERTDGLRATKVELDRRPEPGVVAARLSFER